MSLLRNLVASLAGRWDCQEECGTRLVNAILQLDDDEVTFMLAELDGARQLVEARRKRGEQAVLFCVTIWTALIGALALILSTQHIGFADYDWMVGTVLLIGSAIGHVTIGAFVSAVCAAGTSRGRYLAARQYFLDRFRNTRRYLVTRSDSELLESWRSGFRRDVAGFLGALAMCNAVSVGISIGLLSSYFIGSVRPAQTRLVWIVPTILGLVLMSSSLAAQEHLIRHKRKQLETEFRQSLLEAGIAKCESH